MMVAVLRGRGAADSEMSRADRRYGLYASRTRGKWLDKPHVVQLAPVGWKLEHLDIPVPVQPYREESTFSVSDKESRSARLRR